MNTDFDREPALQPISRDHGVLLVLVQRLRKAAQATAQDRAALATEIQTRHADLVEQYLGDEQIALSKMNPSYLLTNEIAEQHGKINETIKKLTSSSVESLQPEDFDALANIIEDHVRWDERVVLPYLQRIMSTSQREELSMHTSQIDLKHDRPIKKLHHSIALNKFAGEAQTCTCADSL
jgi:hypothetical protein